MSKLLDRIAEKLAGTGLTLRTTESRNWLKQNIRDLAGQNAQKSITQDKDRKAKKIFIGKMYMYFYDPKGKDTLPYYDRFPLVIPIQPYDDGFLGLNLHYLPMRQRIILLDKLYDTLNNDKFDDTTKMRLSYRLLSGARKFREFEPCLKRYLFQHMRSKMICIEPDKWEVAVFLPVEKFVGESARAVQKASQKTLQESQNK